MKTAEEWDLAFDILWNNIVSDKAPGLEKYEKSLFLTQAQSALVKDYFSPNSNTWNTGFDDSIRRQSDFRSLIETEILTPAMVGAEDVIPFSVRQGTLYFRHPQDMFLILNEELQGTKPNGAVVYYNIVPISYEEYSRLMKKPYKYPPKGIAWRLITDNQEQETGYQLIELIGRFINEGSSNYRVRYVKRPSPIILEDLPEGLSIEGKSSKATCLLPEHLHDEILQRAVMIAKITWLDLPGQQAQASQL